MVTKMIKKKQISGYGTVAEQDVGTSAGNVLQLDSQGRLPAVDASQLTGISGGGGAETSVPLLNVVTHDASLGNYTVSSSLASGSLIFVDMSTATSGIYVDLPSASSFGAGKYLTITKTLGGNAAIVRTASGDTARLSTSFNVLNGQSWTIMSDGSSKWITLNMGQA